MIPAALLLALAAAGAWAADRARPAPLPYTPPAPGSVTAPAMWAVAPTPLPELFGYGVSLPDSHGAPSGVIPAVPPRTQVIGVNWR